MKLQKTVNFSLRQLCPQEEVLIYQSLEQKNIKGKIENIYAAPLKLNIAVQSQAEYLKHKDKISETELKYKAYLPTEQTPLRPAGIVRRCARSGDFIQRADQSFYLIVEVLEDFSAQGWMAVSMVLQSIEPDFKHSAWWTE